MQIRAACEIPRIPRIQILISKPCLNQRNSSRLASKGNSGTTRRSGRRYRDSARRFRSKLVVFNKVEQVAAMPPPYAGMATWASKPRDAAEHEVSRCHLHHALVGSPKRRWIETCATMLGPNLSPCSALS